MRAVSEQHANENECVGVYRVCFLEEVMVFNLGPHRQLSGPLCGLPYGHTPVNSSLVAASGGLVHVPFSFQGFPQGGE